MTLSGIYINTPVQYEGHRPVQLCVDPPGGVRVNAAHIHRDSPEVVAIYVDLHSKHASVGGVAHCDGIPGIGLDVTERTLHTAEGITTGTIVWFPEYAGWEVFAADVSKYTLSVALVKNIAANEEPKGQEG